MRNVRRAERAAAAERASVRDARRLQADTANRMALAFQAAAQAQVDHVLAMQHRQQHIEQLTSVMLSLQHLSMTDYGRYELDRRGQQRLEVDIASHQRMIKELHGVAMPVAPPALPAVVPQMLGLTGAGLDGGVPQSQAQMLGSQIQAQPHSQMAPMGMAMQQLSTSQSRLSSGSAGTSLLARVQNGRRK